MTYRINEAEELEDMARAIKPEWFGDSGRRLANYPGQDAAQQKQARQDAAAARSASHARRMLPLAMAEIVRQAAQIRQARKTVLLAARWFDVNLRCVPHEAPTKVDLQGMLTEMQRRLSSLSDDPQTVTAQDGRKGNER